MSDLSPKQLSSMREASARVNLWTGSIRSGKTISSLLRFLIFAADAPKGGELVVIARTRESAARNVFGPLMDDAIFGTVAQHIQYTPGAPTANILGRRVHVIGASDAKSEKVIRGLTVAGAYVDEVTVIPEEFFTQLLGRMSVPGAQMFATTNPDNPAFWLKRKFIDRIDDLPDWRVFHFTLPDNPTLTPEYIAAISREFTGLWYRRFILGEWVAADGAVFDMWDPDVHVIPWARLPPMHRLLAVGIDFGTTHASAALLLGLAHEFDQYGQRTGSRLYLVDEWRYDAADKQYRQTNAQQSESFRGWLDSPHLPQQDMRIEHLFIDHAAASFSVQLQADGLTVANADKDVQYGIPLMASLLAAGRLIVSDRCQGFITEAPGYSWDTKASERGKDEPVKVADDSLDAARYSICTTESIWRQYVGLT